MSMRDDEPRRAGGTLTAPPRRPPVDDVHQARAGIGHSRVTYGPRSARRPPRDLAVDWARGFVRRYGWRAYALPILFVVTIAALATTTSAVRRSNKTAAAAPPAVQRPTGPPVAGGPITLKDDAPGANVSDNVLKAAALPPGPAYTKRGAGTYRVLKGTTKVVGTGTLYRYSVDVERGITGFDAGAFGAMVDKVLDDPRSWTGHGMALQRVDSGPVDFHVTMTSALTVRTICGYDIKVETSCYSTPTEAPVLTENRVVFNVSRWTRGSTAYVGDVNTYRIYMINHEVGHALSHQHAHQCLPGGLAPVMMQQTFGLRSAATDKFCQANPWPYPGARGAPGAEQADTVANDEYGLAD